MAAKLKGRQMKGSFEEDDILDTLLDDSKQHANRKPTRSVPVTRNPNNDNFFSALAEEFNKDGHTEESDVSDVDPDEILRTIKDLDSMESDAGLFGSRKKPSSAPAQTKGPDRKEPKKGSATLQSYLMAEPRDEPTDGGNKPNSAPSSFPHGYKKTTFSEEMKTESATSINDAKPAKGAAAAPTLSPVSKRETTARMPKRQNEVTFDDEKDDLMDALGYHNDIRSPIRKDIIGRVKESNPPQRARTRLDEILERGTSPHLLERPPTGNNKNKSQFGDRVQKQEKPTSAKDDDLTFGSYQPTLGTTPEGHQPRRQSVRFSDEDVGASTPEKKSKPVTPNSATSTRSRSSADWLGLKTDDIIFSEDDAKQSKPSTESQKAQSPPPMAERKSSLTAGQATPAAIPKTEAANPPDISAIAGTPKVPKSPNTEDKEDWLAGVLSRKKAQSGPHPEPQSLGEEVDLESLASEQNPKGRQDTHASITDVSEKSTGLPRPNPRAAPVKDERMKTGATAISLTAPSQSPSTMSQSRTPSTPTELLPQVTLSADSLQQLLLQQQMIQSQLLGGVLDAGSVLRLKEKEQRFGDHQASQARLIQLEGQVKTLQLELEQSQVLLESIQQRHKQDTELIENSHKARVKMLEESAAQKDTRARQECEDLMERLATVTRLAEQERTELQAQYQRKLAQAQQERDREVERLRDLQRKCILEMKKDHEDQISRVKKLKDEEIDAVTSATSQTRSLTVVIEQMEQFSTRLGEISSRVESTHEHTSQSLEQGARQRDEQLQMMQERLAQQQRGMAEERARLKEIIARMDTQLIEQQRQLEKERWRVTAEQVKTESTQRSLEEERRSLTVQINMEREELERAKSALLEEQQSVMQHCAEERRKLAAEWARFHAQEKQRLERAEKEANRALERDAHREGSIISLAQEQADLKLRAAELKQKEMFVAQQQEVMERQKQELDLEKDRLSGTALRLKTRAQEVEAFSKLATERYEEGERALHQARMVENEHQTRLRNIHSQMERMREQEQRLHQERTRMTHLHKETQWSKHPVAPSPLWAAPVLADLGSTLPNPEPISTLHVPLPSSNGSSQAMELQASLAMLKYTAEKDHDYLQDEQFFLNTLKKSCSSFHTD